MMKFLRFTNKIIFLGLLVVAVMQMNLSSIAIVLGAFAPFLLKWLFSYEASDEMILFLYLFFISAYVLGVVYKMYHTTTWMDLLAHFLSGVFFTFVGLFLAKHSKLLSKNHILFTAIFLLSFSALIAVLWESCEYTYDTLFDKDTQWVKETGVSDTMEDMMIAEAGSLLVSGAYIYFMKKNPKRCIEKVEKLI